MALERVDKLLANTGRWSRKEAAELVRAGRVTVSGTPVGSFRQFPQKTCRLLLKREKKSAIM